MRAIISVIVLSAGFGAACSSDEETERAATSDTGADSTDCEWDWSSSAFSCIEPPLITPCPAGWREVEATSDNDVTTCDPWPESGPAQCAEGEAHFPGEPVCMPIGQPCPTGDWAVGLPNEGNLICVRAGETGGDGTQALPFGRIEDATDYASFHPGTVIALSKGTFDEVVDLSAGTTLWGACVTETPCPSPS